MPGMLICDISIFNRYGKMKLDELIRPLNVDWRELVVILVLAQAPGISQSRLVPFLQTDKANVTKLLGKMEDKGWIVRSEDPRDLRNKRCGLTDQGSGLVPELELALQRWESVCYQGLEEEEIETFRRIGGKIGKNLLSDWNGH